MGDLADRWFEAGRAVLETVLHRMHDAASLIRNDAEAGYPVVTVNSAMLALGGEEGIGCPQDRLTAAAEDQRTILYEVDRELPGGRRILSNVLVPVSDGPETCQYIVHIVRDVTDLRKAEHALAETESLANIGHWVWDIDADDIRWSDQLHRIWGVEPDEFEATYQAYLDMVHPDDVDFVDSNVRQSYTTGEPFEFEHRIVRPDGKVRAIHSRGRTVTDDAGQAVRMAGTAQDITRRKELEAAKQAATRAKERQEQALELNDDVMQRLSSAWLALETGEPESARSRLEEGLLALRGVISELLAVDDYPDRLDPGGLIRSRASEQESAE